MLIEAVSPSNLTVLRVVEAECQICYRTEYVKADQIEDGHNILDGEGWRSVEIHGVKHDPVCPTCQQNLKD